MALGSIPRPAPVRHTWELRRASYVKVWAAAAIGINAEPELLIQSDRDALWRRRPSTLAWIKVGTPIWGRKLQSHFGATSYARVIAPYLDMERLSVQGLADP
ncbi:hypothetical protein LWC34_04425 [Kibdelosporangium philippinense]|uniref:Uncharacterized protein n=1 Tax=Kibdelosporangium philippinense TaxID=211113 RepID=A0ABS8Z2A9_9PSEU|nr:hypothetical protein [Kibdelosporangium philippinense]MCE7002074.1 hypothetical protein [Kibdelosporangium philippinense]